MNFLEDYPEMRSEIIVTGFLSQKRQPLHRTKRAVQGLNPFSSEVIFPKTRAPRFQEVSSPPSGTSR